MLANIIKFHNIVNYLKQDPIMDWLNKYGVNKGFKKDFSKYLEYLAFQKNIFKKNLLEDFIQKLQLKSIYSHRLFIKLSKIMSKNEGFYTNVVLLDKKKKLESKIDLLISSKNVYKLFNITSKEDCFYIVKFAYFTGRKKKNNKLSNDRRHFLLKCNLFYDFI